MKIVVCSLLTFVLVMTILMIGCTEQSNTNTDYKINQHDVEKITFGCVYNRTDYYIPPDYYFAYKDYEFYVDEQNMTTEDINITYTVLWAKQKLYPDRRPFIISYFEGRCS